MRNPLLTPNRPHRKGGRLRRVDVKVPTTPRSDAVFLVLRRMRMPLIFVVAIFTFAVVGLSFMPGVDDNGNPYRMTIFDSFYFMSYAGMTIGFGEYPYNFSIPQRMWTTLSVYLTVVGWAYSLGALFSLMQDSAFRDALARQRFGQRIRHFRDEFIIIAGYGHTGRMVAAELDHRSRRLVVLDARQSRIDVLESDQLWGDVPGLAADPSNVTTLGLAGIGNKRCKAVLALTEDDHTNLAIVMSSHLLRPKVPVIARCANRVTAEQMANFEPAAIINPYDRYGAYLVLSLRCPSSFRLVSWLLSAQDTKITEQAHAKVDGRWVVLADGPFGDEVAADLRGGGLDVVHADPADGPPDMTDAVGIVCGAESDTTNLAVAAHVRLTHPDAFLAVRQQEHSNRPVMTAFAPDSTFFPSEIVVQECLARIVSPGYWAFLDYVMRANDEWSAAAVERIRRRVGSRSPTNQHIVIGDKEAPAVRRWLTRRKVTLRDVLRDPDDRDQVLPVIVIALKRGGKFTFMPDEKTELHISDELVLLGGETALADMAEALYDDSTLQYTVTGRDVPTSLLWRRLTGRVMAGDRLDDGGAG